MKYLFLVFSLLFVSPVFGQADPLDAYDVSKAWENAEVHVPGFFFTKDVTNVEVQKPMPVVIYMHGCSGIHNEDRQWASLLNKQGYIVVMPNSLAIPGRPVNCDRNSKTTNLRLVPVNRLRPKEARYTLSKVKEQVWADKDNIFLMGQSEGGMSATRVKSNGFKGIIISGFHCVLGVNADPSTPILALNHESDPWFHTPTRCSENWGDRQNSKEVVLPGTGHSTVYSTTANRAVIDFLKQHNPR